MQKQNRAGRIALKIATLLLCAVFATTSVLSTTFAKYTTTGESASDSARVAKWGIELTNVDSDATKSWTVEDNGASITAASTASDNIIAPGTSGYLARFKLTGNPEVSHNVSMNYEVTIPNGYKKLIGQEDYFPILITVGRATYDASDNVTARKEIHYYVSSAGSLDTLIGQVNSGTFSENIVPNGWSGSDYAEYYVRWDWFYNADDVPSYIPENVKTALTAYQSTGKDTLLAEAMVQQLGKDEVEGSIKTLKSALTTAKDALSGTPTEEQISALESALATYLGVSPRSHATGTQTKKTNVNWYQLYHQGAMISYYNNGSLVHSDYFNTFVNSARIGANRLQVLSGQTGLAYFTETDSSFPITDNTYYQMTFRAANWVDTQYAGVVFLSRKTSTGVKPFLYYGGLGGESKLNDTDEDKNWSYACIEIDYANYGSGSAVHPSLVASGQATRGHYNVIKTNIADTDISGTNKNYGNYRVTYDGKTIYCEYQSSASAYTTIAKLNLSGITDPMYVAPGIFSRDNDSTRHRTMILRDVVITERTTVTTKSVMQSLINEVQAIIDAQATDRDFTISANADITITQIKSSIDNSKYDELTSQIEEAKRTYKNENASDADRTAAITALEADLAAYLGIPERTFGYTTRTFGYTTNETMAINWQALHGGGLMRAEGRDFSDPDNPTDLDDYSDNYKIGSSADENSAIKLTAKRTTDNVEMFYLMDHNKNNPPYPITKDTYYVYDFHARNSSADGNGGVVFAHDGTNTYTLYGSFANKNRLNNAFHLKVMQGFCENGGTTKIDQTGTVRCDKCGTQSTFYGIYRIIYDGLKVTVQYKSSATAYSELGTFTLPEGSYITLGAMVHLTSGDSFVIKKCNLTKPTLSPQTVLWDLINEATAVINPSDD